MQQNLNSFMEIVVFEKKEAPNFFLIWSQANAQALHTKRVRNHEKPSQFLTHSGIYSLHIANIANNLSKIKTPQCHLYVDIATSKRKVFNGEFFLGFFGRQRQGINCIAC